MYVPFGSSALRRWSALVAAAAIAAAATGCGGTQKAQSGQTPAAPAATSEPSSAERPASGAEDAPPPPVESQLPEGIRVLIDKPFTGDFDEMVKRRMIRVGVTYNRTFYFIDKGVPAVQIFTEPHADYHRPGDTADRIDADGLAEVTAFAAWSRPGENWSTGYGAALSATILHVVCLEGEAARTPGIAFALDVSTLRMRAAGCGEVTILACSMPGSVMSWTKVAVPRTLASPSMRAVEPPT